MTTAASSNGKTPGFDPVDAGSIPAAAAKARRRPATRRTAAAWGKVARSKYRAKPTVVDGFRFASQSEARRYQELLHLGAAGQLRNLELQPRFDLHVGGVKVGTYVADFRYEERQIVTMHEGGIGTWGWRDVVEDRKGFITPVYRMKKKHVEAEYGIKIRETR